MANLPDLDTGSIGYIAYYNVIDSTPVDNIDPSEAATDGSIQSITTYDNGIQIDEYGLSNGRVAQARVKDDGWFIVYLDRTENTEVQVGDMGRSGDNKIYNNYDIIPGWNNGSSGNIGNKNAFEGAIDSMTDELSNSATINNNFDTSDIGLYHYKYDNASATTQLGCNGSIDFSFQGSGCEFDYIIESGTDLLHGTACAATEVIDTLGSFSTWVGVDSNDRRLLANGSSPGAQIGSINIEDEGYSSANTSYSTSVGLSRNADGTVNILAIWT